jgi:cytoskeletal protein CcmA (bactofilin family)
MNDFRPEEKNVVYIGEGVSVNGAVRAQDIVVVDGSVDGEISCAQLIVGVTGVVNGVITVTEADVYGKIGSDITIKELLIVRASGRVEGKWTYGEIEVEKGGILSGSAESTEYQGERRPMKEERMAPPPVQHSSSHASSPYKRPELIVNEGAPQDETRVASLASRVLRDRKKI